MKGSDAMTLNAVAASEFAAHRTFLWGLCYRMTGSAADADDIVQETFVRALERPPSLQEHGWRSWLARVATNVCIDTLRRRKRREYTGPWLPSPIETGEQASPPAHELVSAGESTEYRYDLVESVSMAFLLALEHLTPRQRAVLILRDVFDYTVQETAKALDLTQANVKVTHHRARQAMKGYEASRARPTRELQARTADRLRAFLECLRSQDVAGAEALLAADARALSDGGGEFYAAVAPVAGRRKVARLLIGLATKRAVSARLSFRMLNGLPAVVVDSPAPKGWAERFTFQVQLDETGHIAEVHTVLATPKLTGVRFEPV
jgi:RNA polymerase sigma-70 factor (ECF subfamily)